MASEASIENFLRTEVDTAGGVCVKLNPLAYGGIPDRLVILPGPRIIFVELKRPRGGVIAPRQRWWRDRLAALGCEHAFVRSRDEVLALLGDATQ